MFLVIPFSFSGSSLHSLFYRFVYTLFTCHRRREGSSIKISCYDRSQNIDDSAGILPWGALSQGEKMASPVQAAHPDQLRGSRATLSSERRSSQPTPQKARGSPALPHQSLTGIWEVGFSGEDEPKSLTVPGNWAIQDREKFNYSGKAWYTKQFSLAPALKEALHRQKPLFLSFEGVDYHARVFLNGKAVGSHTGYFSPFSWEISRLVNPDGKNLLRVEVDSPPDPGFPVLKQQIKGIFGQHDARPGGKLANGSGNTGGIWGDVHLEATGRATIAHQTLSTSLSKDHKSCGLSLKTTIFNHASSPRMVKVRVEYGPKTSPQETAAKTGTAEIVREVTLRPGPNLVEFHDTIQNPRLWNTWDRGTPSLYTLTTTVFDEEMLRVMGGETASRRRQEESGLGQTISHQKSLSFGIREATFNARKGEFRLNGAPLFHRGINYIPTQWLSTYSREDFARDLSLVKEAHLNAIRVHAHILPQVFYDLCDEMGIMVLADFPLIWGHDFSGEFAMNALVQYTNFVDKYASHPSIWAWSAHNEPLPYNASLDRLLAKMGREVDPSRHHFPASGFLSHPYPGWYDLFGRSYTQIARSKVKFPTEYGAQGIPWSAREFLPKESLWPPDRKAWSYHNAQLGNLTRHIGPVSSFSSLDQFIDLSQKYQYDLVRYITEHFRRHKYAPTGGAYPFMFKEPWEAISWGVLDHQGAPKLAYFALKEAMSPLLLSLEWKKSTFKPGESLSVPVWIINDALQEHRGWKVVWKITESKSGKEVAGGILPASIPPDSAQIAGTVSFTVPGSPHHGSNNHPGPAAGFARDQQRGKEHPAPEQSWTLEAILVDSTGEEESNNAFQFRLHGKREKQYHPVYPDSFYSIPAQPNSPRVTSSA